jgi:hypothetical protein
MVSRRIVRVSYSIDRPCQAAWMRSWALVPASRFRMVSGAMGCSCEQCIHF